MNHEQRKYLSRLTIITPRGNWTIHEPPELHDKCILYLKITPTSKIGAIAEPKTPEPSKELITNGDITLL